MSELPKGWAWATINDSGEYINGFAFKPNHREDTGLPIIRIQNLTDESKPLNRTNLNVSKEYHVKSGDLLVSWSATLDVFKWLREDALVNQHIFKVVPNSSLVEKDLLFYWLKNAIEELINTEHLHGSTMKHINRAPFLAHRIPIPPLNEQTRIVSKLEELLSDLDTGVSELKTAQAKLIQYRQSLLKAAVEGELTREWRAKNSLTPTPLPEGDGLKLPPTLGGRVGVGGNPHETGAQLLERILLERRKHWEAKQLAKFAEQGKQPPKDWQKKYPEPVQPDTTDLPELPEGWVWATVDQLGIVQLGRQRSPSKMHGINPVKYIRAANITELGINLDDVLEMDFSKKEIATFQLQKGDILLTEASGSAEHVGRPAIWIKEDDIFCFQNTVIRFRSQNLNTGFAFYIFLAYQKLGKFRQVSGGIGINHLSAGKFSNIAIPLPSLDEQEAITGSLESLLDHIKNQSAAIEQSLKQAAAQRKNILRAAFAGELVPQDPNDEPASVLLERIQAERAAQPKKIKGRQAKVTSERTTMPQTILEVLQQAKTALTGQELATQCGIAEGATTEQIEAFYDELRRLDLEGKIKIQPDLKINKKQDYISLKDDGDAA